ncbi:MAG: hypothetical protein ACRC0J_16465, partial [Shewanella oncorhynchi]
MSYTIDGLLGFYAVVGTKECEGFLDALEIAGAKWPDGKAPRDNSIDGECVSLDAADRNIGKCRKKYYEENGYKLFSPASISKCEQWTIYNNTMPLCELTDEQYGKMRRMHDNGATVQSLNEDGYGFQDCALPTWISNGVYRIKSKSERDLFIDKSLSLMTSETE